MSMQKAATSSTPATKFSDAIINILAGTKLPKCSRKVLEMTMVQVTEFGRKLDVPETAINRAYEHMRALYGRDKGLKIKAHLVAAAFLYISCRQDDNPRTMREICETVSNGTKYSCTLKLLGKTVKEFVQVLSINAKYISTSDLIPRYCRSLRLSAAVEQLSKGIVLKFHGCKDMSNHLPASVAAAAIYTASKELGEHCLPKSIRDVTRIKETTFKAIAENLRIHASECN